MKKLVTAALSLSILFSSASLITSSGHASAQEIYATNGSQIVDTAHSYQGKVTYRFGTRDASRLTFDCSSFTQFVFQQNGKSLPWGSRAQANWGTPVSKQNLAIGDLVMFSVNTPGQINHVGIYVGNGNFISNMPSKGVAIASIHTGYWGSRFITARHY